MYFKKLVCADKIDHEAELQEIAARYGFSPKVIRIETYPQSILVMDEVDGDCLASIYGEDEDDIPEWIWVRIRHMIETLYDEECIEYIDITPYNFMETEDDIMIIDFGDAKYKNGSPNWFLTEFLDGENSWNPDYK